MAMREPPELTIDDLLSVRSPRWLREALRAAMDVGLNPRQALAVVLQQARRLRRAGEQRVSSPQQIAAAVERARLLRVLQAEFDGRNYAELAARHGLTLRVVRHAIDSPRRRVSVTGPVAGDVPADDA